MTKNASALTRGLVLLSTPHAAHRFAVISRGHLIGGVVHDRSTVCSALWHRGGQNASRFPTCRPRPAPKAAHRVLLGAATATASVVADGGPLGAG